jgi:hypothetical protein
MGMAANTQLSSSSMKCAGGADGVYFFSLSRVTVSVEPSLYLTRQQFGWIRFTTTT